jgi:hypothetical protein
LPLVFTQYEGSPPRSGFKFLFANPWVVGAIVATAIAVPVAIAASHHSEPASP